MKQKTFLALAVGLPLLMIAVFIAAALLPGTVVDPPRHDFLFSAQTYHRSTPLTWRYSVIDGKLRAEWQQQSSQPQYYETLLYRFRAANQTVERIDLPLPAELPKDANWHAADVGALAKLTLSTNSEAPDGYRFETGGYRDHGPLGLLFGGGHSVSPFIVKSGHVIKIKGSDQSYYPGNLAFVGWILSEQ